MNKQKLGFIGLGIMGFPMAKNLIKAGYSLVVYDIATDRLNEMRAMGAEVGNSCTDVAEKNRILITMLPNSPHVCEVVLGECGTLKGLKAGDDHGGIVQFYEKLSNIKINSESSSKKL